MRRTLESKANKNATMSCELQVCEGKGKTLYQAKVYQNYRDAWREVARSYPTSNQKVAAKEYYRYVDKYCNSRKERG